MSYKLFLTAQKSMPGGDTRTTAYHHPYPLSIKRGFGCHLIDADDNEYIDFINNYTAMIHGHAHPLITKKVSDALEEGNCFASHLEEQVLFAEMLCKRVPSIQQIRFCNSGTEATMFAIRVARAFTGCMGILKMREGYHGTHDAVSFPADNFSETIGIPNSISQDIYQAPFNDVEYVENILKEHADKIAAILVEPVLGAAGVIPPQEGYLESLRMLADHYNVLLIFDEVQTLRLSEGGAQEKFNVTPDLTALGKIIGGGFPVGAFGGRKEIMGKFNPTQEKYLSHGGTFNGNRITMIAGMASMELLNQEAIEHIDHLADILKEGLDIAIKRSSLPISITKAGSLLNLHFADNKTPNYSSDYRSLGQVLHLDLLNKGVYIAPRGSLNISTAMSENEINIAIQAFSESFLNIEKRGWEYAENAKVRCADK